MNYLPLLLSIGSGIVLTGCASLDTSSIKDSFDILKPATPRDEFKNGINKRLKNADSIEQFAMDLDKYVPVEKLNQSVNKHSTYTQVDTSYQYHLKSKKYVDNPTTSLVSGLIIGYENACKNLNGRMYSDPRLPFQSEETGIWPAVCYKRNSGEPLFRFYTYATSGQDPLDKTYWSVFQYPNKTSTNNGRWLVDATSNSIYHVQNEIKKVSPKLSSKVSMDGRNLKIGYLSFNKTRFDSLPLSCFKTTVKVHDDSLLENSPLDEPTRGSMANKDTYAKTIISNRSGVEAKCLDPKLRSATLYFGANRLTGASFKVDIGSSFVADVKRNIPNLKLVYKNKTERFYQSGDYVVQHFIERGFSNQKITNERISIWSRLPEQEAYQFLEIHGYPDYYGLRLGQTIKGDLKDLLKNAVQNEWDKKINNYHVLVNLPSFGYNAFGDPRVLLTLQFDKDNRLYEFKISPSQFSTRLPTKTEMDNYMRNSFTFAMLTNADIIELPPQKRKLLSYHYFSNDYPLEKTGGIPLYSVQLLVRQADPYVQGIIFTNALATPNI